jgi:hypothetical protein
MYPSIAMIVVFFFVGPVCISSGSTSAFKSYCAYSYDSCAAGIEYCNAT